MRKNYYNIVFNGVPLRVGGEYEKEESREYYDTNGLGHPGSLPSFHVEEVYAEDSDIDIFELFSPADLEVLAEKILDKLED